MGRSKKNDPEQVVVYKLLLRPESYEDLKESFQWYSNRSNILGLEFIKEIEECFRKIRSNPFSCQKIKKTLRRALIKKFPYGIFYKIDEDEIIVFAIFHLSRNPKGILRRF